MILFAYGCGEAEQEPGGTSQPGEEETSASEGEYVHTVTRISEPVEINSEWDKEPWNSIEPLELTNYMGEEPDFWPRTQVKTAYDDEAIYVIFQVEDKGVRCIIDEYQGPVSRDSCVEFFFTPDTDLSKGYFNVETNCGGTTLFAYQVEQGVDRVSIPESVFANMDLAHSMPSVVDPEITEPVTWTLEYRLPFEILTEYTDVVRPESGVEWRANFYKVASGNTSNRHYVTWSYVDYPRPQFHLPEYFGTIVFE